MTWHTLIDPVLSGKLCLTLLHSLWQASLLAFVVWSIDKLWRNGSIERHYLLNVVALGVALLALPVTYKLIDVARPDNQMSQVAPTITVIDDSKTTAPVVSQIKAEVITSKETYIPESQSNQDRPVQTMATSDSLMVTHSSDKSPSRWLMLTPWIAAFYIMGVTLILVRLIVASIRANRLRADAVLVTEGPLIETLRSLALQWSMKVVPALACAEEIVVPKVVGIVRPTILLPVSAISGLTMDELELILKHELAHIRRFDMWVNLVQRFAEALLFFNPALWYLSRRISILREYCCDEMTCRAQSHSVSTLESRVRYATTLLRIVELAKRNTSSDLTSLAISGRSPSEIRRRVARLFDEPLREPLRVSPSGVLSLLILGFALAMSSLVYHSIAQIPARKNNAENKSVTKQPQQRSTNSSTSKDTLRTFQLNVVDPDGKPISNASVEIRTSPAPTTKQILRGRYVRASTYGPFTKTDDAGRLTLTIPHRPQRFNLSIKQSGYGPYWAGWSSVEHPQVIPDEFTAKLDKGWTIGGVILDETGQPVAGAKVSLSIYYKKRPGETGQFGTGTRITTDANGLWKYESVPVSNAAVFVAVNHSDYEPLRQKLPRKQFEVKGDAEPTASLMLKAGLMVTGTVTDEKGKPIPGALVRTRFMNEIREAKTDQQGEYHLVGCEPRMARIVVFAKGHATDMQKIRIDPDMDPIDFSMKPGGKVRVHVIDEQGNGIPKARIFFQRWRDGWNAHFDLEPINQYADENGVWEWNEAPLDEFQADICRPNGMQLTDQSLIAREAEYVFKPPKALIVSGSVVDTKTNQPIKKFRVTPGLHWKNSSRRIHWNTSDSFESFDGKYLIRVTRDEPAHFMRIEADGYQVTTSRAIKPDEGKVNIDFSLEPAQDIAAKILTATGKPAAKAKIALGVVGSTISIKQGEIGGGQTYATRFESDNKGQFRTPARNEPFELVITHPAGFAHLKFDSGPIPDQIKLTPWARLEGIFRVGKQAAPNVVLTLFNNGIYSYSDDGPNIFTGNVVTTDENGHFVFERVFPGKCRVGRRIMLIVNQGTSEVTSSNRVPVEFIAGKTTTLNLGGTGRRVVGKLATPASFSGKLLWNLNLINVEGDLEPPSTPMAPANVRNDPDQYKAWEEKWTKSPEGQAWQGTYTEYQRLMEENPYFTVTIDRDGSFHIDDVPAGSYVLKLWKSQTAAGHLKDYHFSVPFIEKNQQVEPIDLGTLTLGTN